MIPVAEFDALVLPPFDDVLLPMGFQRIASRVWAMTGDLDIRPMFALRAWKGAAYAPSWGISLAIVPHLSGQTAKWHRTHKSAEFDIWEDAKPREMDLSTLHSRDAILRAMPSVVAGSLLQATAFWDSTRHLTDIPATLDRLQEQNSGWFGMRPQMRLADYVVSKRLGLHDRAETALAAWRINHEDAKVTAILEKLGR